MTAAELVEFHTRHTLLLMAHSPTAVTALRRLVARSGRETSALVDEYSRLFRVVLARHPTRGHADALQHATGYLRHAISTVERAQLSALILGYHRGESSLEIVIAQIRHATDHDIRYLQQQVYLSAACDLLQHQADLG